MAVLRVVSALANDALVELIEAVVGQIASTLRSVEQDLNSLSVEIFGEQHTQRKQVKKLGLKRMVQRLRKQNSLIACLREGSVSLAALTSYFLEHGKGHLQPGVTARLKTVEQDIGSLRQYDAELSSEVSFLLDSTVGLITGSYATGRARQSFVSQSTFAFASRVSRRIRGPSRRTKANSVADQPGPSKHFKAVSHVARRSNRRVGARFAA
jgi:Mg2+ and Co2+ transporter CorA